ncbi:hypothetical protein DMB65_00460 [Flavobacterium cheongpyeongense]|uniref:Uncharacterized protein n=1 Tax=Flavobacterium cheongpyeongense TaxID=2212651 RepID=A0A2V4C8K6_9FLAO|nr:hypothetical protein [Flavobacterium cheongpyeongense]PXY42534.1 hypothetical protein DMB65_00460 [Flavobacterium cheongpyeongense]
MKKFGDIETKLYSDGNFKEFPTLFLHDIPREKDLQKGNLPKIENSNQVFLFARSYDLDIKVNTNFDVLYSYNNINECVKTKCILKYISVNPSYEIDYIPSGVSALCLFEFEDGKPEILNKLLYYMDKDKHLTYDNLIITQMSLYIKISELLNSDQ